MAFSRAAALRSCFRAGRPTAARPTSQFLRQVARRGYASGGHESHASSDAPWAAGALIVTVPTCWFLYQNGPDTSSHGHGGHGDDHAKKHEEPKKEAKKESKDEPEEKPEASEEKKDEPEKSEKSDDSESADEKSTDTPDTSDDEEEPKSAPDTKGTEQGKTEETGESEEPKDKAAASKPAGSENTQSGKQEGLSNTDTKHSTDVTESSDKSSKSEGDPESAKSKGTVDSKRPQNYPTTTVLQSNRYLYRKYCLKVLEPSKTDLNSTTPRIFLSMLSPAASPSNHEAGPHDPTSSAPGVILVAHRQSLGKPTYIQIPPRSPGNTATNAAFRSPRSGMPVVESTQSLERPVNPITARQERGEDEWMVSFCQEPPGDCGACCQGFWCPCTLYGKTQYRLHQITQGKSPLIVEKRRACDGPCWAFWGLALIQCSCILTAFQHTRVRSRYNIKGSIARDFAASIFCGKCILMQDDRELRAREGQSNLRTNKKYDIASNDEVVQAQPVQISPMRYIPPRPASEEGSPVPPSSHESREEIPELGGLAKNRIGSRVSQHNPIYFPFCHLFHSNSPRRSTSASKKPHIPQPEMAEEVDRPFKTLQSIIRKKSKRLDTEGAKKKHQKQARVESNDSNIIRSATNPDYHEAVAAYGKISGERSMGTQNTPEKLLQSRLKSYDLRSSSSHDAVNTEGASTNNVLDPRLKSHTIMDCTTVGVQASGTNGEFQHKLAACNPLLSTSPVGTQEHSLSQDQVIRRSTISELSYVHDFAGCPIDGDYLKYIEREERMSQQAGLGSISRRGSNGRNPDRPYTHTLRDCKTSETEAGSSNQYPIMKRSHRLNSCPMQWYGSVDKPMLRQHRIASCPSDSTYGTSQARLGSHPLSEESNEDRLLGTRERFPEEHGISQSETVEDAEDNRQSSGKLPEHDISHCEPEVAPEGKGEAEGKPNKEENRHHRARHSSRRSHKSPVQSAHNTWAGRKVPKLKKGLKHHKSSEPLTVSEKHRTSGSEIAVHFALPSTTSTKVGGKEQRNEPQTEVTDHPSVVLKISMEPLYEVAVDRDTNEAHVSHDMESTGGHTASSFGGIIGTMIEQSDTAKASNKIDHIADRSSIPSRQHQKRPGFHRASSASADYRSYDRKSDADHVANHTLGIIRPKILRASSAGAMCCSDGSQNSAINSQERAGQSPTQKSSTIEELYPSESRESAYDPISAPEAKKTAQHALARCLAIDAERKTSRKGKPGAKIVGMDGAADFKHRSIQTRSEESVPTFTSDEIPLVRLRVCSEGKPTTEKRGKSWGWLEAFFF
ncbi:hypothetical protein BP6252_00833 [Coleophoma cylindrospora]|uniref:PLAC8 family protein n=1 Tax=Coleophoma cylindrospora TaxID=1849047 RepID=A0A3D8SRK4_9HELO|nr:hypothetical protein BP6252_00833 [Coleophoma cylindrospora]